MSKIRGSKNGKHQKRGRTRAIVKKMNALALQKIAAGVSTAGNFSVQSKSADDSIPASSANEESILGASRQRFDRHRPADTHMAAHR